MKMAVVSADFAARTYCRRDDFAILVSAPLQVGLTSTSVGIKAHPMMEAGCQ